MASTLTGDAEKGQLNDKKDARRRSSVTVVDQSLPDDKHGKAGGKTGAPDFSTDKGVIDFYETVPDDEGEIQYRSLRVREDSDVSGLISAVVAGMLMLAETVSLGVLSIPAVFAAIGFVGGVLTVLCLGVFATATMSARTTALCLTDQMADAGMIMGGPFWREFLGAAQIIFLVSVSSSFGRAYVASFIAASHTLTGQIALDTIAGEGRVCAVVWSVVIAVVSFVCTLPRTFKGIAHLSIVSFISILASVIMVMIGLGVNGRTGQITAAVSGPFSSAFLAVTNVIFAYAGHAAFLQFISEMRDPNEFNKISDTTIYLVVGIVVYVYVGADVSSPAISNLGTTLARITYGIAIPTIIIAGVINASVAAKLTMHRVYNRRGVPSRHMTHNTAQGWAVWIAIVASIWILGFLLAAVIPFFEDMLSVIASLFASIFTWAISGAFWLHLNPRSTWFSTPGRSALACVNIFLLIMGAFIMVGGLYASITDISQGYTSGKFGSPFTCARPST